jgi:type IV pilus assembly protein PilO
MNFSDINNLDLENVGAWPVPAKMAAILFCCLVILGAGWYLDIQNQRLLLQQAEQTEQDLKPQFEFKQQKAASLEPLKLQLAEIKKTLGELLRRLPDKSEVANLLVDISQQGLGAGLEFELFKPGAEQSIDFYIELPIQIRVTGNYHQFGQFISGVADLPRIVTQHDIKITPESEGQGLVMETTAKTYRYLEENHTETAVNAPPVAPQPAK